MLLDSDLGGDAYSALFNWMDIGLRTSMASRERHHVRGPCGTRGIIVMVPEREASKFLQF